MKRRWHLPWPGPGSARGLRAGPALPAFKARSRRGCSSGRLRVTAGGTHEAGWAAGTAGTAASSARRRYREPAHGGLLWGAFRGTGRGRQMDNSGGGGGMARRPGCGGGGCSVPARVELTRQPAAELTHSLPDKLQLTLLSPRGGDWCVCDRWPSVWGCHCVVKDRTQPL